MHLAALVAQELTGSICEMGNHSLQKIIGRESGLENWNVNEAQ